MIYLQMRQLFVEGSASNFTKGGLTNFFVGERPGDTIGAADVGDEERSVLGQRKHRDNEARAVLIEIQTLAHVLMTEERKFPTKVEEEN
uniref:Uncharacterized protein n=1 Tax=Romanomermis culicivorax TaxID=13658 RepID=A0A915JFR9_ROMCU